MLSKLLEYYESELDIIGIALKHYKWRWRIFWSLFLLDFILLYSRTYALKDMKFEHLFILITATIILFIWNLRKHRLKYMELIRVKFHVRTKDFESSRKIMGEIILNEMKSFLLRNNISSESKLKILLEMINKEIEAKKLPKLFIPGFFFALLIPIWSQLIRVLYDLYKGITFVIQITTGLVMGTVLIVILFGFAKMIYEDIRFNILDNKLHKLQSLSKILQEILLRL